MQRHSAITRDRASYRFRRRPEPRRRELRLMPNWIDLGRATDHIETRKDFEQWCKIQSLKFALNCANSHLQIRSVDTRRCSRGRSSVGLGCGRFRNSCCGGRPRSAGGSCRAGPSDNREYCRTQPIGASTISRSLKLYRHAFLFEGPPSGRALTSMHCRFGQVLLLSIRPGLVGSSATAASGRLPPGTAGCSSFTAWSGTSGCRSVVAAS